MDGTPSIGAIPTKYFSLIVDEDVDAETERNEEYRRFSRHRKMFMTALGPLDVIAGGTFGLSPFTSSLNVAFGSRFVGVWVTATLLCVTSLLFLPTCEAMRRASPRIQRLMFLAIVPLYALGFLLGAIAVRYNQMWLLFVGWAVPVGTAQVR